MYIDIIPNRNSAPAILLRESYREGHKIKKKTIANISKWPSNRILMLDSLLKGDLDNGKLLDEPPISGPIFGILHVLKSIADRMKISSTLGRTRIAKIAIFLVLARVATQGSRFSALKWAEDHAILETLGLDLIKKDELYNALDWLADNQNSIEKRLFKTRFNNNQVDMFLYDVTSSYLEGMHNELADWGYNRDRKNGKKQIVIGLLTNKDGDPISISVFEGNTGDTSTVPQQVLTVAKKFNVKNVTFVGDKGMLRGPQIVQLETNGFNYITSITKKEINKLILNGSFQYDLFSEIIAEVEEEKEVEINQKNVEGEVIRKKIIKKIRYVLRRNPYRLEEIRNNRNSKMRKIENFSVDQTNYIRESNRRSPQVALKRVKNKIETYNLDRVFLAEYDDKNKSIVVKKDLDALQEAEKLDGCYVIKTDLSKCLISKDDIHSCYKNLSKVERAFKLLKTDFLEIRPIYVRLEKRTRGHVFSCMLAYILLKEMRECLKEKFMTRDDGLLECNEKSALEALSRITLLFHKTEKGGLVPDIIAPDDRQKKILNALNVEIPDLKALKRTIKKLKDRYNALKKK